MSDSPIGQSAWILEKFYEWTDCDGHPENALSRDELIDNIMFYWLTNSGASSARMYWGEFQSCACSRKTRSCNNTRRGSVYSQQNLCPDNAPGQKKRYTNIQYWNELDKGGHFAAFEQPELFVGEMRNWLRIVC